MNECAADIPDIPARLRGWLERAVREGASDLHLVAGHPPVLRLHGELRELPEPPLDAAAAEGLLRSLGPPESAERLRAGTDFDCSFALPVGEEAGGGTGGGAGGSVVRFRVNLFRAGGLPGACLRVIPATIPDLDWAGFPPPLADRLADLRDGLVVVTGPTGSGKTTTLAMVVDRLHRSGGRRILTVEEPVEYLFGRAPDSLVTQREVGRDVASFADGLKYGLRQDPDVFLVGEVRDRETAQMALSAAETGHLVFTTLHTRDAKGAISRLADLFPQDAQAAVRSQLAMSLRAVVAQRLLPDAEHATNPAARRHLALEVLWTTHPVASAIRTGRLETVDNYLLTGRDEGMLGFDESVRRLYRAGSITREVAERHVSDVTVLNR